MKSVICFLVLVSSAIGGPIEPKEDGAYFRRFILMENKEGGIELVDLAAGEIEVQAELSDVTYYLFTPNNKEDPLIISNGDLSQLDGSNFDPSRTTVFLSHGWNNDHTSNVNVYIGEALMAQYNVNLFVVDWSGPANSNYLTAKDAVVPVGQFVADFINGIQSKYGLSGSSFVLMGHSLGAHVVGNAGAALNSPADHIIGMDPAAPLFTMDNTANRLDASDANFVQVVHTNSALLGVGVSVGHADYYPNGGRSQPGCGLDLTGSCSHGRSYQYIAESLTRGNVFMGVQCSSYDDFEDQLCSGHSVSPMGTWNIDKGASGDYFLNTNEESPFGQG